MAALVALAGLSLGVPLYNIGRWLWAGGAQVWSAVDLGSALSQTIALAAVAAALTAALAFPVAWVAVYSRGPLARAVEAQPS